MSTLLSPTQHRLFPSGSASGQQGWRD